MSERITQREVLELVCRLDKYADGCEQLADEISLPPHQPTRPRSTKSRYDEIRERARKDSERSGTFHAVGVKCNGFFYVFVFW